MIAVALISGLVIGSIFGPGLAIQCVISVLVSACPCALSLITPMAVKIGMKKAAEHGVHFSNGKALQAAADIDTIVFDLNGTLTQGQVVVNALHHADRRFLRHIALLESQSDHAVAPIIKTYLDEHSIASDETLELTEIDKSHHSGIKGLINGEVFMIGNQDMLLSNGINPVGTPYDNPEKGSIYMVRGQTIIGQIELTDPLRHDAITTINQLQRQGKSVHICTGADRTTAEKYASLLGIPKHHICANTVGTATQKGELSKTSYIEQLKSKGHKVAMVGDALNDVPAILTAHTGVAIKSDIGDDTTLQHAGIAIQEGSLFAIATAFDIAEKTKRNIFQNLIISLTYNSVITLIAAGAFIAIGFALNPALGVALMIIESAIILGSLYYFKQQDVVSASSNNPVAAPDKEHTESTTSKILNALGFHFQPEAEATNTPKPQAGSLFAPAEPPHISDATPQEIDNTPATLSFS